jgi:hypothetical protein
MGGGRSNQVITASVGELRSEHKSERNKQEIISGDKNKTLGLLNSPPFGGLGGKTLRNLR